MILAGVVVRDNQRFGAGKSQSGGWVWWNYLAHILQGWVRIVRWKHLALAQLRLHTRRSVILVVLQNYFVGPRILGWTVSSKSTFILVLIWAQIHMPSVILASWPLRRHMTLLSLYVRGKSLLCSSFELQILIKMRLVSLLVESCSPVVWHMFGWSPTARWWICIGESLQKVGCILAQFLGFRLLLVLKYWLVSARLIIGLLGVGKQGTLTHVWRGRKDIPLFEKGLVFETRQIRI